MEVTSKNFKTVLEEFPSLLKNADFVAIDTEFTGLRLDGKPCFNYFDTLKELYNADVKRTKAFLAVQYGITLFKYDPEHKSYSYRAYNFYTFPKSKTKNFSCQVSCLKFLAEHGFDFNKLFNQGISYLTNEEYGAKIENLESHREKLEAESPAMKVTKETKNVLDSVFKKIQEFISNEETESFLPRYNAYVRRLIYQKAKEKFEGKVLLEGCEDETIRMVKGLSEADKSKRQEEKWEKAKADISEEVGFSKIIKLVVDSRKPIVGHNILVDLLFTIQQYLQPLPESYEEFREMLHFLFPILIDTKYVATASNFKDFLESSLSSVLDSFSSSELPTVKPESVEFGYEKNAAPHEAGYDAYITGLAFLAMLDRMGFKRDSEEALFNLPLLKPFFNKLSVPRMHDISCIDLEGEYEPPKRHDVFHLTFPEEWKRDDILAHFKDYGFVNIRWVDSTSAFMSVGNEYIKKVMQRIKKNQAHECKVTTYAEFRGEPLSEKSYSRKRVSSEDLGEVIHQKRNCEFPVPAFD